MQSKGTRQTKIAYASVLSFQGIAHKLFCPRLPISCLRTAGLKVCHALCNLHELSSRQPPLSWTATSFSTRHSTLVLRCASLPWVFAWSFISVAASPPAALYLARLRVALAAAKALQTRRTYLDFICICIGLVLSGAGHKSKPLRDLFLIRHAGNIGCPRLAENSKAPGLPTLAPLAGGSPHSVRKPLRFTALFAATSHRTAQGCFTLLKWCIFDRAL